MLDPHAMDIQPLLDELCVKLGFCLPPLEQDRLREHPPIDVDAFTDAVFAAEGLDPLSDRRLRAQVRATVERHFARQQRALPDAGADERYERFRDEWDTRVRDAQEGSRKGNKFDAALAPLLEASEGTVLRRFFPFTSTCDLRFACSPYPFERIQPPSVTFVPDQPYRVIARGSPPDWSAEVVLETDDAHLAIEKVITLLVGC